MGNSSHTQHTQTDKVLARLSRIEGHVSGVRRMVADGKPCPDVLTQLAAIKAAVNAVSRIVLEDHMEHCFEDPTAESFQSSLTELKDALASFIKHS